MAQYFINKDDVLRIIKNEIYVEEVYNSDTCEEWTYEAIDGKEVIEEINKLPIILIGGEYMDEMTHDRILTSRTKGKWIPQAEKYLTYYECSECGAETEVARRYCAWCGALMEDEE